MTRLHVNLSVSDLDASVRFYSQLFRTPATILKVDYAKWMLDNPRLNFALTTHGKDGGLDHLGLQAETLDEFHELQARLEAGGGPVADQGLTTCCYAHSRKSWTRDPEGLSWEIFLTTDESAKYSMAEPGLAQSCCTKSPAHRTETVCCD